MWVLTGAPRGAMWSAGGAVCGNGKRSGGAVWSAVCGVGGALSVGWGARVAGWKAGITEWKGPGMLGKKVAGHYSQALGAAVVRSPLGQEVGRKSVDEYQDLLP